MYRSSPANNELAQLARAVGNPMRVQILKLLIQNSACICGEIVEALPLAQSTVSQHLKVLCDSGLVKGDSDGPKTSYWVDQDVLRRFKKMVLDI